MNSTSLEATRKNPNSSFSLLAPFYVPQLSSILLAILRLLVSPIASMYLDCLHRLTNRENLALFVLAVFSEMLSDSQPEKF